MATKGRACVCLQGMARRFGVIGFEEKINISAGGGTN